MDQKSGTRQAVGERGTAVADVAKEHAGVVVHDAKAQASELVHQTRERLRVQAEDQTGRAADMLQQWSGQLRAMANGSQEGPPQGQLVDLARQGADRMEAFARRLSEGGVDGNLHELTRMARRRPGMFLAGAFAVGLMAGRLAKNADAQRVRALATEGDDADAGWTASGGSRGAPPSAATVYPQPAAVEEVTWSGPGATA
jgi:hypothetical protein